MGEENILCVHSTLYICHCTYSNAKNRQRCLWTTVTLHVQTETAVCFIYTSMKYVYTSLMNDGRSKKIITYHNYQKCINYPGSADLESEMYCSLGNTVLKNGQDSCEKNG